ncbi:MAG TPA: hypothetical protein VF472_00190 [Burkholderiaceae bacterium]
MNVSALSVQEIVAVIRQQIAAPVNRTPPQAAPASTGTTRKAANSRQGAKGGKQAGLGGLIAKRLGALDRTDPERGRKAFRIFLESVLLNEFGEQLINDPGFYQMVDGIQMQMESNAEIAAIMQQAIAKLLGGAAPDSTT